MNNNQSSFGDKVVCTRPPHVSVNIQILITDSNTKVLTIEFGAVKKGDIPDWSQKRSLRLSLGEVSVICAVCLKYLPKGAVGFRQSKLSISAINKDDKLWLTLYHDNEKQQYLGLTHAETYELYLLCLQILCQDNKSSETVLNELASFYKY
jgi:hypothetical protein